MATGFGLLPLPFAYQKKTFSSNEIGVEGLKSDYSMVNVRVIV